MNYPWYKEFAYDLLADFQFNSLSMKERGLLFMLKLLAATNKFAHGKLVIRRGGKIVPLQEHEISLSLGVDHSELVDSMKKLVDFGLVDFFDDCYFFEKMISERKLSEKRSKAGSKGGSKTQAKPKQNIKQSVKQPSVSSSVSSSVSVSDKKGKAKKFQPPELQEVVEYFFLKTQDMDLAKIESEKFIDFYLSKGWKVGNSKMKDWQASVRNWLKRNQTLNKNEKSNNKNKSRNRNNPGLSTTDEEFLQKNGYGDQLG